METLLIIGITLLAGLVSSVIIKAFNLPQMLAQMGVGILLGVSGFKLFGYHNIEHFRIITELSLGLVGFFIGAELRWARLKKVGIAIFLITIFETTLATTLVCIGVFMFTKNLPLAIIIGSLAAATAPGGTTNIIKEYRTRGPLTNTLFGVVGADDALAILIFTIGFHISKNLIVSNANILTPMIVGTAVLEHLASIGIGIIIGIIFLKFMSYFEEDDTKQIFTFSFIIICIGIAKSLGLSLIMSCLAFGILISNIQPHASRSHVLTVAKLTPPIYILFFVLIGANLDLSTLWKMGIIGLIYIIFRTCGKLIGAWTGATLAKAPTQVKKYLGFCLLSQAGISVALAISAQTELETLSSNYKVNGILLSGPEIGIIVLNVITASTLVFQIIGPLLTKMSLEKAGEIKTFRRGRMY